MTAEVWQKAPAHLSLRQDEVHVWRAGLDASPRDFHIWRETLAPDELDRAERFHFPPHAARYIAARGILRDLLGRYLRVAPAALRFSYSPSGKPSLAGEGLFFNLSHSGGLALYAITRAGEVGVDVERIRPGFASSGIPEDFFAPREVAALRALPAGQQDEAFFRCWTLKEAFLKARGDGLSLDLKRFEVGFGPDAPAALRSFAADPRECDRWSLLDALAPGDGYAAALAVAGHNIRLTLLQYTPAF